MKILQINSVCNFGSTGKITYDIHKALIDRGIDSIICFGRRDFDSEDNVYRICSDFYSKVNNAMSRITGIMYGGCFFSTNVLLSIIRKEKPDVVHLQCINGNFVNIYKLVKWLNDNRIPTVLTLHAEFMYTANCGHAYDCEKWKVGCKNCERYKTVTKSLFRDRTNVSWEKMRRSFSGFTNLKVISVSPWLMNRAKQSPFFSDNVHQTILNGVDTSLFKHCIGSQIRDKRGWKDKTVIFHATASFDDNPCGIKGGYYVLEMAKHFSEFIFVVAGEYSVKNVPSNVVLLGNVVNQCELAEWYSIADVTLLTSKRETFSMVTAESLCCGTPVVGFKAGAPEQIAIKEYSSFAEYGDINKLRECLLDTLSKHVDKTRIAEDAKIIYDKKRMVSQYIKCYERMINEDFN